MWLLQISDTQLIIFYNNLPLLNQLQRNCYAAEFTGPLSNESSQITGAKWLFSAILYQRMPCITGSSLLSVTLSFIHSWFSLTGIQFHFYCFDSPKKKKKTNPLKHLQIQTSSFLIGSSHTLVFSIDPRLSMDLLSPHSISLCNVVYRVAIKVLVNKRKSELDLLVARSYSKCLYTQQINFFNLVLASELYSYLTKKKKKKSELYSFSRSKKKGKSAVCALNLHLS